MKQMYHISLDGPQINLKFYKVFRETCFNGTFHSLIDIGVCSLHVVYGACRTGAEASCSKMKATLKISHKILR